MIIDIINQEKIANFVVSRKILLHDNFFDVVGFEKEIDVFSNESCVFLHLKPHNNKSNNNVEFHATPEIILTVLSLTENKFVLDFITSECPQYLKYAE